MSVNRIIAALLLVSSLTLQAGGVDPPLNPAAARHQRVEQRRQGIHIICHRGAVEFAHENILEAFQAAFALGADGNEIDIRATKDGVLICFHDDMLDHLLDGYGDIADYSWNELQRIPFRNPGRFEKHCRIPTLRQVFELHRDNAGLMHLDVKRPGLVEPISKLLDELDLWDHVVQAPADFTDPRYRPTRGKAGLYLDRGEVDPAAIKVALEAPGERIILEFPQGVAVALGRKLLQPSRLPVHSEPALWSEQPLLPRADSAREVTELLHVLQDAGDWNAVARGEDAEAASAARIELRARAADGLLRRGTRSPDVFTALEERVRSRSLHRNWRYCGLDGSAALRALLSLDAPRAVEVARYCLWRDDPAVEAAKNPEFANPRSWTDWRTKMIVFPLLESHPGEDTEQLCRDYLALGDDEARTIGVPQFEAAAKTLLAVRPTASTVKELLDHRLSVVRGRAILFCLAHNDEPWAREALRSLAPHALPYADLQSLRIALIGDSTVASYPNPPADRPGLTGWGQVLDAFFTDQVEVINHARSGRSSKSFIREGQWVKTLAAKPDYVLIQFGHNDQPGKGDRTTDPAGDYRDYLRQFIREAKGAGIRPILVTPVARRRFEQGKVVSTLGPWVEAMHEVGAQELVPVIDLHAASVRLFDQLGDDGSRDLSVSDTDRTHFSRKGAQAVADLVVQELRTVEPALRGWLAERSTEPAGK